MISKNNTKNRIFYIDQLRALAIIAVVCAHIALIWMNSKTGNFNSIVSYVFNVFGRYGVPIFLTLTGALLLNKNYDIYGFLKKRFPRIIYPWIFWIILAILVTTLIQDSFSSFNSIIHYLKFAIKTFLTSRWYVWMLIGVYLVIPIINEFVKNKGLKGVEYFLVLWFITSIISCISLYFNISTYFLDLTFFAGPLGFVMLGYYLHNKKFKYSPNKLVIIGLILFILGIALKVILLWKGINIFACRYYIFQTKSHLEIDIFAIIETIGMFIMIKYLSINIKGVTKLSKFLSTGKIRKLTNSLSRSSFGIYLNHYIIISIITSLSLNLTGHNALKWIPFLTVIVLITSWGLILIINKIPFMRKISGYY